MSEIRIGPKTQLLGTLVLIGGVGAIVAAQLPEIRRYLSMRSM
jgi:hypothetical protein